MRPRDRHVMRSQFRPHSSCTFVRGGQCWVVVPHFPASRKMVRHHDPRLVWPGFQILSNSPESNPQGYSWISKPKQFACTIIQTRFLSCQCKKTCPALEENPGKERIRIKRGPLCCLQTRRQSLQTYVYTAATALVPALAFATALKAYSGDRLIQTKLFDFETTQYQSWKRKVQNIFTFLVSKVQVNRRKHFTIWQFTNTIRWKLAKKFSEFCRCVVR